MITRRTKIQLLIFVLITLIGVTYTGARYARLDRVIFDNTYVVVAHLPDSGGIFSGGEVTYRGVRIGQVQKLELVEDGVDAYLQIDEEWNEIPQDARAVVANRSAVGEQFVEVQPQENGEPYLEDGSEIAKEDTQIPISTTTLLTNLDETVRSVKRSSLRTTVMELGTGFDDTGEDLQRIIDTGNSFIETADENFDVTRSLIRNSNVVLKGQLASESALRSFARDMRLFSGAVAKADGDLRTVINNGSATANQLRTFLKQNEVNLSELLNQLVTTGRVVVKRLDGVRQLLVLYPYVVEAGFTVVSKDPQSGLYDAHFGLVTTEKPICERGYQSTNKRTPQQRGDKPMNTKARCTEPPSQTNARGSAQAPKRAGADYDENIVGSYDADTGQMSWGEPSGPRSSAGSVAPPTFGKDSWKWLYLQPQTAPTR